MKTLKGSIELWTMMLPISGSVFAQELQKAAHAETLLDHDHCCALLANSLLQNATTLSRLPHRKVSSKLDLLMRLEVARSFFKENISHHLTLKEIANEACLSLHHLNRCFSAAYGTPPLRFAQNLRLDTAKDNILRGTTVRQAAEEAGFSSISAFSRAYRLRHGHPPSKDTKNRQFQSTADH